ncbi:MAG: cyclodeaminase/cyclohydrolase family protein [Phycisphaerales bacterium]|nr:cyclodeaminase/cyclohydrolase family protein [Phycisphaerales bacterium]
MQPLASFTFGELLESTAAKSPTPGGGAVASAVGALGAALAGMVVSYSVGKKNLAAHETANQAASKYLANARALLVELGDEDAQAYGVVNELMKLPEGDERRTRELPGALRAAAQIPLATMGACADVLRLMEQLSTTTNRQLRSDLGIAAVLACAAAESSLWNVEINVPSLAGDEGAKVLTQARACAEDCRVRRARVEAACRA